MAISLITAASQGGAPAFSVYANANQSVTASTNTKVQLNTKNFDTANCFDTSAYRYTPNVAGYYQISYQLYLNSGFVTAVCKLYKNGSNITWSEAYGNSTSTPAMCGSILIYMNGSTDYIELYVNAGNNNSTFGRSDLTWMTGSFVRSA